MHLAPLSKNIQPLSNSETWQIVCVSSPSRRINWDHLCSGIILYSGP